MRSYDMGDAALDEAVNDLLELAMADNAGNVELVREMVVASLKMLRDGTDRSDLKLLNSTLKEMRSAFLVFRGYRDVRKVTMYGSARTEPHDPNYQMAAEFARRMVDQHRCMVITGAGPGIMEAGNRGAGSDYSFGVNIRLPFEDGANPYVHESRLINYKYFFTRKLTFVKESDAFVLFPGGFGTLDESFELLTLMQTGKSDLHPVVMLEAPGTGYWGPWVRFVDTLVGKGMIAEDDLNLFTVTTDLDEAIDEIRSFYTVYHSQRYVSGDLILRLVTEPTDAMVEDLNTRFSDIVRTGRIEKIGVTPAEIATDDFVDLPRLRFRFDRRHFGRLRCLIDHLNGMDRRRAGEPE
ncbi:MAG TPA: TIGR00730 family Rossman fold protein [Acidimicrobiia bacterium]|nr:TIGR00730 family Rossman fold protein [Acidimicrobiia bacterium]